MRPIDADALYRKVKAECNPYGKPSIGWEDGQRMMEWIEHAPTVAKDINVPDKWVSVKDRMPERKNACLAVDSENRVVIARYKTEDNCSEGWYSTMIFFPPITHWMPLPEPPKEDT